MMKTLRVRGQICRDPQQMESVNVGPGSEPELGCVKVDSFPQRSGAHLDDCYEHRAAQKVKVCAYFKRRLPVGDCMGGEQNEQPLRVRQHGELKPGIQHGHGTATA